MTMSHYANLNHKLKNIFQIDRPDLDFGVYRILNSRHREISDYLDNRLQEKVRVILAKAKQTVASNQVEHLKTQLLDEFGKRAFNDNNQLVDDEAISSVLGQQYVSLMQDMDSSIDETQVFSHLLTFFSRYYDEGDFISQRRYKGDTYAIPYSGEEVMLHWANKDQYYTKSGEMFSNYRIRFTEQGHPDKSVLFRLLSADTAKDNQKDNDKDRRFVILTKPKTIDHVDEEGETYQETINPVEINEAGTEITIWFEYAVLAKGTKQEKLNIEAHTEILDDANIVNDWHALLTAPAPTETMPKRDMLLKHLNTFTQKHTADYFIHKDLGKFLNNELDFYIKNEVMQLDDIVNSDSFTLIERRLAVIKCLRQIGGELITFLASLEDFQKRLWLKKKFVVSSHYCITLDRIDESLYADIADNNAQWEQWETLGLKPNLKADKTDWKTQAYLSKYPYLMVDTSLYNASFKAKLLNTLDDLDEQTDGVIIHSDNFQALNLLQETYREQVQCIYIDPPYNTGNEGENGFIYKDNYKHSSWASMMADRIEASNNLMTSEAGIWVSTDDGEYANLKIIMDSVFSPANFVADVIWKSRYSVSSDTLISGAINHTTFFAKDKRVLDANKLNFRLPESEEGFSNPDNDPRGLWKLDPMDAPNIRENLSYGIKNPKTEETHFPPEGRHWRFEEKDVAKYLKEGRILFGKTGTAKPGFKRFYSDAKNKGRTTTTLWDDVKTTSSATKYLYDLFKNLPKKQINEIKPKPIEFVKKIQLLFSKNNKSVVTLDYFAGSGTTAHATIALNREDSGKRKYILVEQGEYFDTVLKPRIQKVVYSPDWKNGKPELPQKPLPDNPYQGISHCLKVMKLESYEDTLNNLHLTRTEAQEDWISARSPTEKDDYLMSYMLDIESRDSLLNVVDFNKPFDYQLQIATDSAGAYSKQQIDLMDTFNYLLGLRVKNIDYQLEYGFVQVTGYLRTGEYTTIIWRDCDKVGYEALDKILARLSINALDSEYQLIYVNGDHNINTQMTTIDGVEKQLKVRSIEQTFLERMFAE